MDNKKLIQILAQAAKDGAESLDLSDKGLTILPPHIGKGIAVTYNRGTRSQYTEIVKLTKLKELNLRNNQLTMIPHEIGLLNLTKLNLENNRLTELPSEIGQLIDLKELHLKGNQLTALPVAIGRLTKLMWLVLKDNQLTTLPTTIGELANLKWLDANNNQLTTLPTTIGKLTKLMWLDLSANQLATLPKEIRRLTNLIELHLRSNQLTMLLPEICQMTNLQILDLGGNPLPVPPEMLITLKNDPVTLVSYYLRIQTEKYKKRPLNEAKVLIVGQGAVGKTSLIKRLAEDRFDPLETKTEGIDIDLWELTINGIEILLNVWDFGGQEIMHATHQFFLTKRSLYLLVLDSRLDEQENRLEYWLKIIQSFGADSPIVVVCNKSDENEIELDWRGLQNKYPAIKAFAKRVSCKTGEGIPELIEILEREVDKLEHIRDELPISWFEVKTQLEKMKTNYISYKKYQQMCVVKGVPDKRDQETLISFVHDLGVVLHFHDHPILEDTNVLKPEWVTNGVYQILNSNMLYQQKGVLYREALDHILDPKVYPRNKHQFIIDMMLKFELCFDFPEYAGERFLVPDLLAKEEPDTGEWDDSLSFQYHYDILPSSIISRFIVRMYTYISKWTYWRTGVVLISEDRKNRALVKADIEDKKIFIYVAGKKETRSTFLTIIRADFRKIHASISKLNVKEKIPIPGHPDVVADYEHLLTLEELGEETFIPEGLRVKVSVKDLLHGVSGSASKKPDLEETPRVFKNSGSLRVGQQIEELQQQWSLLSEKLSTLEQTKIFETKVDEKIRIEKLIEELTAERQQIGQQLNDLEAKLSSSK